MRNTLERRYQILELLSDRRTEKVGELAYELGVSTRTIKYDIQILSLSAPIFAVRGRYGGGIYVAGEWRMDRRYLHNDQEKLLLKLMDGLQSDDKKTMQDILTAFAKPKCKDVKYLM